MEISAKQVMELRRQTGLPMMKCKKALTEADGDFEKAFDILRKDGAKTAEQKRGRKTAHGLVGTFLDDSGSAGGVVQVQCETESVAVTPMFLEFVDGLTECLRSSDAADAEALKSLPWKGEGGDTVEQALLSLVSKIRENIQIGGVAKYDANGNGCVGIYRHHDKKTAAMVALQGEGDLTDFARDLCMHIVFSRPQVLHREDLNAADVEKETSFLREQIAEDPKMKGKPEAAVEGILKGRLEKLFFGTRVLTEQPWYRDNASKVQQHLDEHKAKVREFILVQPGE